jgi:hypothetical protein
VDAFQEFRRDRGSESLDVGTEGFATRGRIYVVVIECTGFAKRAFQVSLHILSVDRLIHGECDHREVFR